MITIRIPTFMARILYSLLEAIIDSKPYPKIGLTRSQKERAVALLDELAFEITTRP